MLSVICVLVRLVKKVDFFYQSVFYHIRHIFPLFLIIYYTKSDIFTQDIRGKKSVLFLPLKMMDLGGNQNVNRIPDQYGSRETKKFTGGG